MRRIEIRFSFMQRRVKRKNETYSQNAMMHTNAMWEEKD